MQGIRLRSMPGSMDGTAEHSLSSPRAMGCDPGDPGYDMSIGRGNTYKALRALPMGEFGSPLSIDPARTNDKAQFYYKGELFDVYDADLASKKPAARPRRFRRGGEYSRPHASNRTMESWRKRASWRASIRTRMTTQATA